MNRVRQFFLFDRFLARVFNSMPNVILKGGVALELRLSQARTTRDLDLRAAGDPSELLNQLREAAKVDLEDGVTFTVELNSAHPTIEGDGVEYEGQRFIVKAQVASRQYGDQFGTDVSIGDVIVGAIDKTSVSPVVKPILEFIGMEPAVGTLYPRETHIAEKLHAYTLPRTRPNSRVKDLPDIALLATVGPLQAEILGKAIEATFKKRKTHGVPKKVPPPPTEWDKPYQNLVSENAWRWKTLDALISSVQSFLDPVLANSPGSWDPKNWTWKTSP